MPTDPPPDLSRTGLRPIWTAAGLLSLGTGIVGIFLPVIPTTPLVLLAAFCFGKGSPRLRRWILSHRRWGPMIQDWEETGAIPRSAKYLACGLMAATFAISVWVGLPFFALAIQGSGMAIGAAYVLSRPDR